MVSNGYNTAARTAGGPARQMAGSGQFHIVGSVLMSDFFSRLIILASAAVVSMASLPTYGNPLDMFGAGAVNIAMGGTGTATADSFEAAYYNPAALGLAERIEFGAGVSVYRPWLDARFNSYDAVNRVTSPVSARRFDRAQTFLEAGVVAPIPLGKDLGRHLFVGLHVYSPADVVYSVIAREPTEPAFPLYEDRNRRLVLNAALSGRYKWLMFGIGISVLPTVKGTVRMDLADTSLQDYLGIDVGFAISPNAGLLFEPIDGLTLGIAYRGAGRTRIELPVDAAVTEVPLFLTVNAATFWTPHQVSFGIGWKGKNYRVAGDVIFSMFSGFQMAAPSLTVFKDSGRDQVSSSSTIVDAGFRDTASVRLGAEFNPIEPVALRAGFSWTQSPLSAQSGITNMLGGDQFGGSFGIGFDAAHVGGPNIKVDAYFMAAAVIDNTDSKLEIMPSNPGYPSIGGGGWFINSGLSIRFGF